MEKSNNSTVNLSTADIFNLIHHMELDEEKFEQDLIDLRAELESRKIATYHNLAPGMH